jgi:protein-S-isoprenylcysteine O-methyltransferase Ste14
MSGRAWLGAAVLVTLIAVLLFAAAGAIGCWQAWVFLGILGFAVASLTRRQLTASHALLRRRAPGGSLAHRPAAQRVMESAASISFVALLVLPALDHRFRWSAVPMAVVLVGDLVSALAFAVIDRAYRENPFAFATIDVIEGQRVVSTGLYARVRHPMYAAGLLLLLAMPLALGSYWGYLASIGAVATMLWRLVQEERLLVRSLPGYAGYCESVRQRLIPGVL